MSKLVRASDVHTTIEKMGVWSIEDRADFYGVLTFEPTRLASLRLLGFVSIKSPKRITALCEGGRVFTCYDATGGFPCGNVLQPNTCTTTLEFASFWMGPCALGEKESVAFRQCSFGINGLESWYCPRAFDIARQNPQNKSVEFKYKYPKELKLYSDERVVIKLGYNMRSSGWSIVQNSWEISHTPRVVVKARKGKIRYYGDKYSLESYISLAHSFLAMLIGRDAFQYDISCVAEYFKLNKNKNEVIRHGQVFEYNWARDLPKEIREDRIDVVFPYSRKITERTMAKFAKFFFLDRALFERITSYTYSWTTFNENSLPELLFSFEGLSRLICDSKCREEKLNRYEKSGDMQVIRKIQNFCYVRKDKKRSEITQRLYAPDPSLRDRLTVSFQETAAVFPFLAVKDIADSLKKYLGKRRNGTAHSGESAHLSIECDYWCAKFLQLEMLAMILTVCGVNQEDQKAYFTRPFTGYNHISEYLTKAFSKR